MQGDPIGNRRVRLSWGREEVVRTKNKKKRKGGKVDIDIVYHSLCISRYLCTINHVSTDNHVYTSNKD